MQDPSQHDGVAVCSFCGRNASNARSLEAGAGGAYICNGCVARLYRSSTLGDFTEASSFDPLIGSPERFSGRARTVLALARQEARRFNHNYIGTEHLLLGLAAEGGGLAAISLSELGVDLTKIRTAVEFILGRGDGDALRDIGLTPRAKKVIELAADEAGRFSQPGIGTEHLLLGLIREGDGIACGILESLGVKLENARAAVLRVMKGTPVDRASDRSESDVPDFTNFTEASRKTLTRAQDEALRLNHNYIGTEHLLLGLAGEEQEVAMKVLRNLGVQATKVRSSVELLIGRGDRVVMGQQGLTPRSRKVLNLAIEEAQGLGHAFIDTGHLLLGLMREGDGIAAGVLAKLGVKLDEARSEVAKILGDSSA